jgi:drug/metabolite transporter (DMT)-like permease
VTALLATIAAAVFGCSDFLGGVARRREAASAVSFISQVFGFGSLLVALAVLRQPVPGVPEIALGALAGASGGLGVLMLYAALASGRMGVVAPITAALAGAIPVAFDLATGAKLTGTGLAGIGLALVAVVIVSVTPSPEQEGHPEHGLRAVLLAVGAGLAFAGFFTLLSFTDPDAGLWPLFGARLGSVPLLGLLGVTRGVSLRVSREAMPATIGAGVLDMVANVAAMFALQMGPLAVAAALTSLYPVSTVLLARSVLGERLHTWQRAGVVLALGAVVLTALP